MSVIAHIPKIQPHPLQTYYQGHITLHTMKQAAWNIPWKHQHLTIIIAKSSIANLSTNVAVLHSINFLTQTNQPIIWWPLYSPFQLCIPGQEGNNNIYYILTVGDLLYGKVNLYNSYSLMAMKISMKLSLN